MPRASIKDFELAHPIYRGASVTFYTVVAGVKTTTKAELFAASSGVAQLTNPQKLDGHGKFRQPVYIDVPVIGTVEGITVPTHDTGIVSPAPTFRSNPTTGEFEYSYDNGITWSGTGEFITPAGANVQDAPFNAVGNGVADDTAAIQAALNSGASRVYLPPGTYLLSSAVLTIPSGVELYGDGDASVLRVGANRDVINVTTSNVHLHDFKIDGQRATFTSNGNEGIFVDWRATAGERVRIQRVTVRDVGGTGIQCLAAVGTPSSDLTILDCDVEGCGAHAIISQDYISNVRMSGNRVKDYGLTVADRVGITVGRSGTNSIVSDNLVLGSLSALGSSSHGISMDRTSYATCKGNVVENTIGYGIEVGGVTNCSVSGNTVTNSGRGAIVLSGNESLTLRNENVAVVGNVLYGGGSNQGIYAFITGATGAYLHKNVTVSGNTITGFTNTSGGLGMQLEYIDRLAISGNSVYNCARTGIQVLDSKFVNIGGNTVVNNNCITIKPVVALTQAATLATAEVTAHGYSTADVITVFGAVPAEYNGSFSITVTDADHFTYTHGGAGGLATPAVGTIEVTKPTLLSDAGIRILYSLITAKQTVVFGMNLVERNGFREVYDISANGFIGFVNDCLFLREVRQPRAENLTSGIAANERDRVALFMKNNKINFAYNNAGTINFATLDLDGADTAWANGSTVP